MNESSSIEPICDQIFPCSEKVADEHPDQLTAYRCGQKAVKSEGRLTCKGQTELSKDLDQICKA